MIEALDLPTGQYLDVDGTALYYEEHGAGPPLVLCHGGLGSSAEWETLLPVLTAGFRVVLLDSRGHGHSTNPDGKLSYARLADDVAALIAALGLVRPVVAGWSDGGQAALELAVRHPGVAGALIVGAAYPEFAKSGVRDVHRTLLSADDAGAPDVDQLDADLGDAADFIHALHPGGPQRWRALIEQTASMWLDYEGLTPEEIASIEIPTLVIAADRDEYIPLDLSVSLFRALPNAELAVCPRTSHIGPFEPGRGLVFADVIRDFTQRHAA